MPFGMMKTRENPDSCREVVDERDGLYGGLHRRPIGSHSNCWGPLDDFEKAFQAALSGKPCPETKNVCLGQGRSTSLVIGLRKEQSASMARKWRNFGLH
ncbi:hypothetical protein PoB_002333300 [Plakobranchus ocellatus]|uniref:Uncharacterized protein n=1 Tax=Plakobranchus ocellatus TaxID=259542 RepID=A0AAV3ZPR3_9GAST|nr:hypothetical protein PoB_002333300 [Plakobranchus ocellatus]